MNFGGKGRGCGKQKLVLIARKTTICPLRISKPELD